jgi:hypothetical protein
VNVNYIRLTGADLLLVEYATAQRPTTPGGSRSLKPRPRFCRQKQPSIDRSRKSLVLLLLPDDHAQAQAERPVYAAQFAESAEIMSIYKQREPPGRWRGGHRA